MEQSKETTQIKVRNTTVFKLKDKVHRQYVVINMMRSFGFKPDEIIIEKVHGEANKMIVRAILTKEELDKEQEMIKNLKK